MSKDTHKWRVPYAFASLRYHNYRLWFFGQATSLMGTWMQSVAQGWLVYQLTDSNFALGLVSFASSIPTLFLMLPAGAIIDRVSKRRLLIITQTIMMLLAFILATLAGVDVLRIWHIGVLATLLGVVNSFDAPTRQALTVELVEDRRDMPNAIALNSTMFNLARVIGPAIGGAVLAALGATWCFALNGLSFLAVLLALSRMRFPKPLIAATRKPMLDQIKVGLAYIGGNVPVRTLIALVGVSSLFGASYATLLPSYAADVLHVEEAGLGMLSAAVGAGALAGSLIIASLGGMRRKGLLLTFGNLFYPIALLLLSLSHSLTVSLCILPMVGVGFVLQNAIANTLVQSIVSDELRGRVMAVFTLMFFGTAPFGSLWAGVTAQLLGPPAAIAISGGITLTFALAVLFAVPALRKLEC